MRLLIFLAAFALTRAELPENCPGLVVRGVYHEKELLKSDIDQAYQLAIDYNTHTLFFSYVYPEDKNGVTSACLNLDTKEFHLISGIQGGFANAVDGKNHVVYLGGVDGIYTYDYGTKTATMVGANGTNIWALFFRNKLYYTDYLHHVAYTLEDGESKKVPELDGREVLFIAVDKNDNLFYTNSTGLFCIKKNDATTIYLGDLRLNDLTTDASGDVIYFSGADGFYSIDECGGALTKLADIPFTVGLAIDGDNIIYSGSDDIFRLKPSKSEECKVNSSN